MNRLASPRSLSTLTATITRPFAAYCSCIAFSHGNDTLHGPHQDAKKSTYTTLPARSAGLIRPSSVGRSIAGATAWEVAGGAGCAAAGNRTEARNRANVAVRRRAPTSFSFIGGPL